MAFSTIFQWLGDALKIDKSTQRPCSKMVVHALMLLLAIGLYCLPTPAQAQSCANSFTVQSGASFTLDTYPCTTNLGYNAVTPIVTKPAHGTLTESGVDEYITYTNNGDGATSDSFVWQSNLGTQYTVTITIIQPILITTKSVFGATVGTAYSASIVASGGTPPYSFSVDSGALPSGLSLDSATGVISGTPTSGGTFPFSIKVTDANGQTAIQSYSLDVAAPTIFLSPSALPSATQNSTYSEALTAEGGTSPYAYSVTSGALPSGLTLSGTGVLSGTPSGYGSYSFTVRAEDSSSGTGPYAGSITYTLSVSASAPQITTTTVPSGTVGVNYSQTISATGGNPPYSYSVESGTLPPGISLTSSGVLSGTPTTSGNYAFTVKLTDSAGSVATQSYSTAIVAPAITVSPASLPNAEQYASYSQTLSASGGTAPYSYQLTSGSLPNGLSLKSSGTLSGTPTVSGTFSFTVTATDSSGGPNTGSTPYTLDVTANTLSLPATTLPVAEVGTTYSASVEASGGTTPYSYSVTSGSLPSGVVLSTSTGSITGSPTSSGTYTFSVTVTDGNGSTATESYKIAVSTAPRISTLTLPDGEQGASYSQTISVSGGVAPYRYAISSGTLPVGLTLGNTGDLSGIPTVSGTFPFSVLVTDSAGAQTALSYTLSIASGIYFTVTSLPAGDVGSTYSQSISASGGSSPYTFSLISGQLPAGLALSSDGTISGTPTVGGSFAITVQVKDSVGTTSTENLSLSIASDVHFETTSLAVGTDGVPYSEKFTVSGGYSPYTFGLSSGSLPAGLALSESGTISGTPTEQGQFTFRVLAKDAKGASTSQEFVISVQKARPVLNPNAAKASTTSGTPATVNITSGALWGPFTSAAIISVTPAIAGTATIRVMPSPAIKAAVRSRVNALVKSTVSIGHSYDIDFMPKPRFSGTAIIKYTLSNSSGTTAGAVTVTVTARQNPAKDPDVAGLVNAQIQAAAQFAGAQLSNYDRRMEDFADQEQRRFQSGISIALPLAPNLLSKTRQCLTNPSAVECTERMWLRSQPEHRPFTSSRQKNRTSSSECSRLTFWTGGEVDFGEADQEKNLSGFRFTTSGLTLGGDYRLSRRVIFGAGLGYGHGVSRIGTHGTTSRASDYSLGFYGSVRPTKTLFVDAVIGYGRLHYTSRRWATTAHAFAYGSRAGAQEFGTLSFGYEHLGTAWLFSPFGRLVLTNTSLNTFTERGAQSSALTFFGQNARSLTVRLGLRTQYSIRTELGLLDPHLRVEIGHAIRDQSAAPLAYADLTSFGAAYYVKGNPYGNNNLVTEAGLKLATSKLMLDVSYDLSAVNGLVDHGVRISVSGTF